MTSTCFILCLSCLILLQPDYVFMNSSPSHSKNDESTSSPPAESTGDKSGGTPPSEGHEVPSTPALPPPAEHMHDKGPNEGTPPSERHEVPTTTPVSSPPAESIRDKGLDEGTPTSKGHKVPSNLVSPPPPHQSSSAPMQPSPAVKVHVTNGDTVSRAEQSQQLGECPADNLQGCSDSNSDPPRVCTWTSKEGVTYSLEDFNNKQFRSNLPNPKGSVLVFLLCPDQVLNPLVICGNQRSPSCITVPGVNPTIAGTLSRVEQIEPNAPGHGFTLVYDEGETCEVTKVPRRTIIKLPCNPHVNYKTEQMSPRKVYEGQRNEICQYFVEFPPSKYGCPVQSKSDSDPGSTLTSELSQSGKIISDAPKIWAVSGCIDSIPLRSTADCHNAAKVQLTIHGLNFDKFCVPAHQRDATPTPQPPPFNAGHCNSIFKTDHVVFIGSTKCFNVNIVSPYQINCHVEKVKGKNLPAVISRQFSNGTSITTAELEGVVSFKDTINFREKFDKFVDLGVGGLKMEIDELYRRAFASRSTSPDVLEKLGIGHIKGILLYGPPGSGKTLLARTIGKILGTEQVRLINGPEIVSKYIGESEKNLRSIFKAAEDAWKTHGAMSDLYVIVIDEIDAICKPRGKTDGSSAGVAYDAIVNQLLTLLDGLNEVHNTLVIGMTNRKELLDSALLRPGRFEVQIEVGLPDEEGRQEIFEIHTRTMRESNMISPDVNVQELAANTSRFSGAEIAGVVRAASSYALERFQTEIDTVDGGSSEGEDTIVVTAADFQQALSSVVPAYTHSEKQVVSYYLPQGYLPCGEAHDAIIDESLDLIHALKQSSTMRVQTLLLYGPRGSGKTTIAAHLATIGKFSYVKIISASALVGRPDIVKLDVVHQSFKDAYKSDSAVIILDDIHRLVEFVQLSSQFQVSHHLLHSLTTLLSTAPPAGAKVLIIGTLTLSNPNDLDEPISFSLPELFSQHQYVPLLDTESASTLVSAKNIHRSGGGDFSLPGNLAISIQQLLNAVECACVESEVSCSGGSDTDAGGNKGVFVKQNHLLDCVMKYVTRQPPRIGGSAGLHLQ